MIPVTKPFLPPLEEYHALLDGIWKRNWLTNSGPLITELEQKLRDYLSVHSLQVTGNGTIALQIAIKAMDLKGEVITTPFSYVATTSSIVWENCTPVFVDIDPDTLNIDSRAIQEAITPRTVAILATHVYGNPCDVEVIESIAKAHHLGVIYDGAHCFGTKYKGKSVLSYGDISICSFHATKLYHMGEGGAIITGSESLYKRTSLMRNFGHTGVYQFDGVGINGKNSEIHAALGLVNLRYVDELLKKRRELSMHYDKCLKSFVHTKIKINESTEWNHSYYPIVFQTEEQLLLILHELSQHQIFARRYFYPSLNLLHYLPKCKLPTSESISTRVLCLPMYHDLTLIDIERITDVMLGVQKRYLDE